MNNDNGIRGVETMKNVCQVSQKQRIKYLPILFSGDALRYFFSSLKQARAYAEAIQHFKKWYRRDETKVGMVTAWQLMTLSKAILERLSQF